MRNFIATAFIAVFIVGFVVVNLIVSVGDMITEKSKIVSVVRKADVHQHLATLGAEAATQRFRGHYQLREIDKGQIKMAISKSASPAWIDSMVLDYHSAFLETLEKAKHSGKVSLDKLKAKAQETGGTLTKKADDDCGSLLGGDICSQSGELQIAKSLISSNVDLSISRLPDSISFSEVLAQKKFRHLRELIWDVKQWRLLGAGLLLVLLLAIAIASGKKRAILGVGLALSIGTLAYALSIGGLRTKGYEQVNQTIEKELPMLRNNGVRASMRQGATSVGMALVDEITEQWPKRVMVSGGVGGFLLALGFWAIAIPKKRNRSSTSV